MLRRLLLFLLFFVKNVLTVLYETVHFDECTIHNPLTNQTTLHTALNAALSTVHYLLKTHRYQKSNIAEMVYRKSVLKYIQTNNLSHLAEDEDYSATSLEVSLSYLTS